MVKLSSAVTALLFCVIGFVSVSSAQAQVVDTQALPGGVQRTTYRIGPVNVTPGQNRIDYKAITGSEKPAVNGWITRIKPDLVEADGTIPPSSHVMFHHGVWINSSNGELFYATGEEKTIMQLPPGYGYRYDKNDNWLLNHMIHNLTPKPMTLYFQQTIDFIPDTAPEADQITRARPIWMDVQQGIYPVFDVHRDTGANGEFTYPQDDPNAYPPGVHLNEKTINRDGVLLGTTGHVHTGGLRTDLYLSRQGASYGGEVCPEAESFDTQLGRLRGVDQSEAKRRTAYQKRIKKLNRTKAKVRKAVRKRKAAGKRSAVRNGKRKLRKLNRRVKTNRKGLKRVNARKSKNLTQLRSVEAQDQASKAKRQACLDTQPQVEGNRVHLFESTADYFDPRGPISWDMAMYSTDDDWKVAVKAGDKLDLQATYETKIASWYESMGINIVYWAPNETGGRDPYVTKVDTKGVLNHGHYAENEDYGGENPTVGPDPTKLADGLAAGSPFTIGDYTYSAGGFNLPGANGRPPVVSQGQSLTFQMGAGELSSKTWHSLTSCKSPCNKSTGISYPIPDGDFQFDSGQLGTGGPPTVERTTWSTPNNLPKGTYTFFCRIHPLMRGAFRVK